jgi:hypothetical protein
MLCQSDKFFRIHPVRYRISKIPPLGQIIRQLDDPDASYVDSGERSFDVFICNTASSIGITPQRYVPSLQWQPICLFDRVRSTRPSHDDMVGKYPLASVRRLFAFN